MKPWSIWKRLRVAWVVIAILGMVAAYGAMQSSLSTVRTRARATTRLHEFETKGTPVSFSDYRKVYEDTVFMGKMANEGAFINLIACALIILIASWCSRLNKKIKKLEEAQPPPAGDVANRAAPEE